MDEIEKPKLTPPPQSESAPSADTGQSKDNTGSTTSLAERKPLLEKDPMVVRELELINQDEEFRPLYEAIIKDGNQELLREKSAKQVSELSAIYFGASSESEPNTHEQKTAKLKLFEDFVATLRPIRSDEDHAVYKSPSATGKVKSYGPLDVPAHAEDYVYCSLDQLGHLMSRNGRYIEEADAIERGQIVMNDVSNVTGRTKPGDSIMKNYLRNTFDYVNGKKILALYMAIVFETPEQAQYMLASKGGHPMAAQRWDSVDVLYYRDMNSVPATTEEFLANQEKDKLLTEQFITNMKKLLAETGIEPPLSLEVRIKESARQAK